MIDSGVAFSHAVDIDIGTSAVSQEQIDTLSNFVVLQSPSLPEGISVDSSSGHIIGDGTTPVGKYFIQISLKVGLLADQIIDETEVTSLYVQVNDPCGLGLEFRDEGQCCHSYPQTNATFTNTKCECNLGYGGDRQKV